MVLFEGAVSRGHRSSMDINASFIDQQVRRLATTHHAHFEGDEDKRRSMAFVLLCMKTRLDIDDAEALACLTDGGQDADIDGIHVGDVSDNEVSITLFQGKYKRDLDGRAGYPANSIKKLVGTVSAIFDPDKPISLRPGLQEIIEEIRSLFRDGIVPIVRVVLCNNGQHWQQDGEQLIQNSGLGAQVTWEHLNHDRLVQMLQRQKSVNDKLELAGKGIVEDFNFRRVLIGKIPVQEIKNLFDRHGDLLLERNIRRYLGHHQNPVNSAIRSTLIDPTRRSNFYFFNNGITVTCSKFRYNALQQGNWVVHVDDLQIINGAQTCKTIQNTLQDHPNDDYSGSYVLLRLYEVDSNDQDIVNEITFATNSQNPVELRDLKSNDEIQRKLEIGIQALGYEYKRKRDGAAPGPNTITIGVAAESMFAVWRRKPHLLKFRRSDFFRNFYDDIFRADINAAQVILAVLIFRMVENERRRPSQTDVPRYLPYASYFLAMLVGIELLKEAKVQDIAAIDHRNFASVQKLFETNKAALYVAAQEPLNKALASLNITDETSFQRLSASFRRGDLLEELKKAGAVK